MSIDTELDSTGGPRSLTPTVAMVGTRCYRERMPVKKLSIALPERVAAAAATSASRQGLSLSAWVSRAAENTLAIEEGLAAVAEWEADHGALTAEERASAAAILDGGSDDASPREAP